MPRKKKIKIVDQFIDALKKKLNDASIRDLIYLMAYSSSVYFIYDLLTGHPLPIQIIETFLVVPLGLPKISEPEPKKFDVMALMQAMIAAYIVLKIDVDDIVSATKAISSTVSTAILGVAG